MKRTYLILTLGALASTSFQMYAAGRPKMSGLSHEVTTIVENATVIKASVGATDKALVGAHFAAEATANGSQIAGKITGVEINAKTSSSTIAANLAKELGASFTTSEQSLLQKALDQARKPNGDWGYVNTELSKILTKYKKTINQEQFVNSLKAAEKTGTFTDIYNKMMSLTGSIKNSISKTGISINPEALPITFTKPTNTEIVNSQAPAALNAQAAGRQTATGRFEQAPAALNAQAAGRQTATGGFEQAPAALNAQAAGRQTATGILNSRVSTGFDAQILREPAPAPLSAKDAKTELAIAERKLTEASEKFDKAVYNYSQGKIDIKAKQAVDNQVFKAHAKVEAAKSALTKAQEFEKLDTFDQAEALQSTKIRPKTTRTAAQQPGWN